MEEDVITDEQYINLIENTILENSEYSTSQLTGGNVQLTCAGKCRLFNCKVILYFGYDVNRNNRKMEKEIRKDQIEIWLKALHITLLKRTEVENNGDNYKDLYRLLNATKEQIMEGKR